MTTSNETKCEFKRSDMRMAARAIREGWPISEVQRAKFAADALKAVLTGSDRQRLAGQLVLQAIEAQKADSARGPLSSTSR